MKLFYQSWEAPGRQDFGYVRSFVIIKVMNRQRGHIGLIVIVIIVITLLGVLGYLFYQKWTKDQEEKNSSSQISTEAPIAATKEYKSEKYNISFHYPVDWTVEERIDEGNTAEWYASNVKVLNADYEEVALFGTGGQLGGACSDSAPFVTATTIMNDPLSIKGVVKANFGYTIVKSGEGNYGIAFGLTKDDFALGTESLQCPGMSVNYRYYVTSNVQALGGITFGRWYAESSPGDDPYQTLDEAKEYTQSDEFKKVMAMIKSLKIGD